MFAQRTRGHQPDWPCRPFVVRGRRQPALQPADGLRRRPAVYSIVSDSQLPHRPDAAVFGRRETRGLLQPGELTPDKRGWPVVTPIVRSKSGTLSRYPLTVRRKELPR